MFGGIYKMNETYRIRVKGLVQGVGFRPFIYRIAHSHQLLGWVENRNDGVLIEVNANKESIKEFVKDIEELAPQASDINKISIEKIEEQEFSDFNIIKSVNQSSEITDVSPDIAVCNDCLDDLNIQKHRIDYPFINCTNCGPRFSIIRDLPYDRDKTTMDPFKLCPQCNSEYVDVLDRRFHAQPVACNNCGPIYSLFYENDEIKDFNTIIHTTSKLIEQGKIIAIKGIGGFQICCDATNNKAVERLRKLKTREAKPFAVMFKSVEELKKHVYVNKVEEREILSWRRPILILKTKLDVAPQVSVGFDTIGCMLPYMPFHHQLFDHLNAPALVLTSGNISDEPIVIDNDVAKQSLSDIADAILTYNRDIHNRVDDSVAFVVNDQLRMIRRSRGFVPQPLNLKIDVNNIVAAGAELVNCFCVGKGNQAILSQHIGDLKNLETLEFYSESFYRYKKLFRVEPDLIVHDLHPDYLSTRFAKELGFKTLGVQHHHAHIASVMTEHNIDEKVIGVSFDGTGLGTDGNIWGGEFLIADLISFRRYSHFEYIPLPGGDQVTKQPWRTALSYLYKYFGHDLFKHKIPFVNTLDKSKSSLLLKAIDKNINSPLSSSAGRLFDAVAALIGLCTVTDFHAEAPMRLENELDENEKGVYSYDIDEVISFKPMFMEIIDDLLADIPLGRISAKFHNTIVKLTIDVVKKIQSSFNIKTVALSGGTFQNKFLLSKIEMQLRRENFEVISHQLIPSNDAGIALGQLAIAGAKRDKGLL